MASERSQQILDHGFTPVPLSFTTLLKDIQPPTPLKISSIPLPTTPITTSALAYAKAELPPATYNHSMRVFYYGAAIARDQFPTHHFPTETYLLSCLFHDIATTDKNLHATLLSFEWYSALIALKNLETWGAAKAQAESVAEAIIRHQDIGQEGSITFIGALLQLATVFDNMTWEQVRGLVSVETVEEVVGAYGRMGWSRCCEAWIRKELALKPWAHTSVLGVDAFPDGVRDNEVMKKYEVGEDA